MCCPAAAWCSGAATASKSERYKDLIVYAKGYRFSELDRAFIAKLTATIRELGETEYH